MESAVRSVDPVRSSCKLTLPAPALPSGLVQRTAASPTTLPTRRASRSRRTASTIRTPCSSTTASSSCGATATQRTLRLGSSASLRRVVSAAAAAAVDAGSARAPLHSAMLHMPPNRCLQATLWAAPRSRMSSRTCGTTPGSPIAVQQWPGERLQRTGGLEVTSHRTGVSANYIHDVGCVATLPTHRPPAVLQSCQLRDTAGQ